MAYTPLRISIPEPCREDWNGMTPVDGTTARHCDSCAKNVVDFTGFTDAQLHAYTKEKGAKICGRFRPDQLGRPLRATHKPSYQPLKVAAAAAGMILATGSLEGQRSQPPRTGAITVISAEDFAQDTLPPHPMILGRIAAPSPPPPPAPIVGEMMEMPDPIECKLPPAEDHGGTVEADSVPAHFPEEWSGKIRLSTIDTPLVTGYLPAEIETDTTDYEIITGDIVFEQDPQSIDSLPPLSPSPDYPYTPPYEPGATMGIVYVEPPQPTGWDRVLDSLKNVLPYPTTTPDPKTPHQRPRPEIPAYLTDFTLSPNPMSEKVRLTIVAPEATVLKLSILDATGQEMYAQTWPVVTGKNQLTLRPKLRKRDGIVFVRLTDGDGLRETKALIVR